MKLVWLISRIFICLGFVFLAATGLAQNPSCELDLSFVEQKKAFFPGEFAQSVLGPDRPSLSQEIISLFGQAINVPIGVSKNDFESFIERFRSHPQMQSADGMIIFGSRSHFSYGTVPSSASDLDFVIFGAAEDISQSEIENVFSNALVRSGIVPQHFPTDKSELLNVRRELDWYLTTILDNLTLEESRRRWDSFFANEVSQMTAQLMNPIYAHLNTVPRNALKTFWSFTSREILNKEAMFIVRGGGKAQKQALAWKKSLLEKNYRQVLILPSS